jgi:acryloyl-coenzyme A reductase
MTAIQRARLNTTGWDADLQIENSDGQPAELINDQVRIEVEACGVCYRDCIDRDGRFKFIQLPITPGHEAVGRVVAVGPAVTDWMLGDRVGTMHRDFCGTCAACVEDSASLCQNAAAALGLVIDGGYASHLVAPQRALFRMPDDIPASAAAVLHCTFGTAYRGLKKSGRVHGGSHVLVTGANGGVGTAAIQTARRMGATVTAVVRNAAHGPLAIKLGANEVVVDGGDGFHKRLKNGPADVVMDCVGSPTFNAALRSLRAGGCLVEVGNVVPEPASLNLGYLVTRGISVVGSSGAARPDLAAVLALHAQEPFTVQIHLEMPLAEADRAQRLVRQGGLSGRIVLVPPRC